MAVTSATLRLRWPALNMVADVAELDAAIADAQLQVSAGVWGDLYDLGVTHLAAHALMAAHPEILGPGMTGAGPISSEKVGELSRTYAVTAATHGGGYKDTAPGREYLRLRTMLGLGVSVV